MKGTNRRCSRTRGGGHLFGGAGFVLEQERGEALAADGLRVGGHGGVSRAGAACQARNDGVAQLRVRHVGRRAHLGARPVHQHLPAHARTLQEMCADHMVSTPCALRAGEALHPGRGKNSCLISISCDMQSRIHLTCSLRNTCTSVRSHNNAAEQPRRGTSLCTLACRCVFAGIEITSTLP